MKVIANEKVILIQAFSPLISSSINEVETVDYPDNWGRLPTNSMGFFLGKKSTLKLGSSFLSILTEPLAISILDTSCNRWHKRVVAHLITHLNLANINTSKYLYNRGIRKIWEKSTYIVNLRLGPLPDMTVTLNYLNYDEIILLIQTY